MKKCYGEKQMDKKLMVVTIAIVIVAVVGVLLVPSIDTFQKDYTLKEASKLSDENTNIATNITESTTPRNQIELEEQENQIRNMTINYDEEIVFLNETKKHSDNQTEKLYVDLLINQTQLQKQEVNLSLEVYNIVDQYYGKNISAGNATLQAINITSNVTEIQTQRDEINTQIRQLIETNPELDQHLQSLGLDQNAKYYGKDVLMLNNSFDV